ncbi:DUF2599 domain-containing protein [Pseudomonas putida]|uniref:DUF2599 domain-containing protein n=1 Tax=Pseudomonas putida TaxID=303 RepID=A0A1Q9R354_PSEPU|nr:DUF2599 domain-containing protein [Pseudomonas putida]OLS61808.1 hypothetical protein PSEMO_33520 [Pseudomonas putida]
MTRRSDRFIPLLVLPLMLPGGLALAESCADTLKVVQRLYQNKVEECNGDPASDCSGLLVRGTTRPEKSKPPLPAGAYNVWEASPKAQELGTSAASWMREDINYADPGVNHDNGYLLKPIDEVGGDEEKLHLACSSPLDFWSDWRATRGCGDSSFTADRVETSCQEARVNGTNWKQTQYDPFNENELEAAKRRNRQLCTFDMRNSDRTQAFKDFMAARRSIEGSRTAFNTQTEVRYYNPKDPRKLPILAFFYTKDSSREDALKNQADFFKATGKHIPVIRIQFPDQPRQQASFSCDSASDSGPGGPAGGGAGGAAGGWGPGGSRQCSQYIQSVTWIKRYDPGFKKDIWSASVVPTDCGRQIGEDQTDRMLAEMESKAKAQPNGASYWGDRTSTMRRQLVCHLSYVDGEYIGRNKHEFNLEPIRSWVTHEESLKHRCNVPY